MKLYRGVLTGSILLLFSVGSAAAATPWRPRIPKVWDEAALADWMTPVAGLNVRPTHISAKEYYSMPEYNLGTYPVYMPGREPQGYWEMLQRVGPQRLFEPEKLNTEADWIAAGERIFEESVNPETASFDPQLIAQIRDPEFMKRHDARSLPDGTLCCCDGSLRREAWGSGPEGAAAAATRCGDWMVRGFPAFLVWLTYREKSHLTSAA